MGKFFSKIGKGIVGFFKKLVHKCRTNIPFAVSLALFVVALGVLIGFLVNDRVQEKRMYKANQKIEDAIHNAELSATPTPNATNTPTATCTPAPTKALEATATPTPTNTPTPTPEMTAGGLAAWNINNDYVGWLEILGAYSDELSEKNRVNHPVFQTFDDPNTPYDPKDPDSNESWFYLDRDANKEKNKYGSLFVDERCEIGTGTAANNYLYGKKPASNIIIYGHNAENYLMFGALKQYKYSGFRSAHKRIAFTTCYEYREYEIIAYFRDTIPNDDTYYFASFVNAYNENQFNDWYNYITSKTEYTFKATAEFGDEFLTLVTCATGDTSNQDRVVVVYKRVE